MNHDPAHSSGHQVFPREPNRVGKFEFLMRLGQGGMATVYLARTVSTGGFQRLVAIKLMHQFLATDSQFVEMFLDEARVAANVRHPNVVSIVDLGNENDSLYMVMDYVEGDTLAAVEGTAARLGRAIPLGVVLRIVVDALAGLDAAHDLKAPDGADLKVVHRDVSPQNILVGVDGASRLTDFGIARAEQRIASTRTGMLKGKAPFMAPEQFEGRPVDRRADVFAMGVTLWEAVALRRLFPGRENYESAIRNSRGPYRRLKDILPSVPASLDAITKKALAHNPSERYPTAAAFADAIEGEFRSVLASHRQVGQFMAAVASEKIQRERDSVRNAPKPREEVERTKTNRSTRASFAIKKVEQPIPAAAANAFDSRPPERFPSLPPANDIKKKNNDEDPEVAAALAAIDEIPGLDDSFAFPIEPARRKVSERAPQVRASDADLPAVPQFTVGLPVPSERRTATYLGLGAQNPKGTNVPTTRRRATVAGPAIGSTSPKSTAPPPRMNQPMLDLPLPPRANLANEGLRNGPLRRAPEAQSPSGPHNRIARVSPPGGSRRLSAAEEFSSSKPTAMSTPTAKATGREPTAEPARRAAEPASTTPDIGDSTIKFDLISNKAHGVETMAKRPVQPKPAVDIVFPPAAPRPPSGAKASVSKTRTIELGAERTGERPVERAPERVTTPQRPAERAPERVAAPQRLTQRTPERVALPQRPAQDAKQPPASGTLDSLRVARFPSLVPSPKDRGMIGNRWVTIAVLLTVIFVVGFVLSRGI